MKPGSLIRVRPDAVRISHNPRKAAARTPQYLISMNPTLRSPPGSKVLPVNMLLPVLSSADPRTGQLRRSFPPVGHAGVEACLQLLRQNLQIKLGDLAQISGMSRRGLHKAFLAHLGHTPGTVMRAARVKRACDLLANSNISVAEVAAHCGYRNSNSLWVVFQRDLGISPARFREERRNGKESPNKDVGAAKAD